MRPRLVLLVIIGISPVIATPAILLAQAPKGNSTGVEPAATPGGTKTMTTTNKEVVRPVVPPPAQAAAPLVVQFFPDEPIVLLEQVRDRNLLLAGGKEALARSLIQRLRPTLGVEYHLARTVCELSKDERRLVAREGEIGLMEAANASAEDQLSRRAAGIRVPEPIDPRKRIQDALAGALNAHLPPERASRYRDELEKRSADRRRVAVQLMVAKLDQDLVLSTSQRTRIEQLLLSHWDEKWSPPFETLTNVDPFIRSVPTECVAPYLNRTQARVWGGIAKVQRATPNVSFAPAGNIISLEEEDLAEARLAIEGQGPK